MEKMRINKFLAQKGVASRREIDKMVMENRIKINGEIATAGMKIDENDIVEIDGKKLKKTTEEKEYYIINKPLNVLSSAKDDRGRKTVVELIDTDKRLFPVGRLDYNTSGLLILTNDGELFNRVIHPRNEVYKEYYVKILGEINSRKKNMLEKGVELEDGMTLPAKVEVLSIHRDSSELKISIREGRNRQVRRMIDFIGSKVIVLRREKIGKIELGDLKIGEYRKLTKKEIEYLYSI